MRMTEEQYALNRVQYWRGELIRMALDPRFSANAEGSDRVPSRDKQLLMSIRDTLRTKHGVYVDAPIQTSYAEDAMAIYIALLELYPEG